MSESPTDREPGVLAVVMDAIRWNWHNGGLSGRLLVFVFVSALVSLPTIGVLAWWFG